MLLLHPQQRYFSEAASEAASASAETNERPPIIWTTHRLQEQQIEKVHRIFHKLLWLDMFEIDTLNTEINRRLGIVLTPKQRNAISRALAARNNAGAAAAGDENSKTESEEDAGPKLMDLKLLGFDAKSKIKVIKEVRSIAGLGLKEAKELVEGAPVTIIKELKEEQANEIKVKLEEIGAQVEIS